jgi:DNA-binding HxlR family transcriptional regulator
VEAIEAPRGSKTDRIVTAIGQLAGEFTVSQLEQACPGISRDMIRRVLRDQRAAGLIECRGRGPAARWRKKG